MQSRRSNFDACQPVPISLAWLFKRKCFWTAISPINQPIALTRACTSHRLWLVTVLGVVLLAPTVKLSQFRLRPGRNFPTFTLLVWLQVSNMLELAGLNMMCGSGAGLSSPGVPSRGTPAASNAVQANSPAAPVSVEEGLKKLFQGTSRLL